jgi:hypothetical protein
LQRVYSIPIVTDGLTAVHTTLSQNAYTQGAYSTATALGTQAYQLTEPIQVRLAPVLVRADGFANKGLDVVEGRFPYPFQTPTDQIVGDLKTQADNARNVASKTIDERIRAPVSGIVLGVDKSLTPLVDYYETTINKYSTGEPSKVEADSQVQRIVLLTRDARDQVVLLSSEQLKQLQAQSVLIQRATETVYNLNVTITSTYNTAKGKGASISADASTRVHELSQSMIQELEKLQATTKSLPANLQTSLKPLTDAVSTTVTELRAIIVNNDATVSEKATQVAGTVQQQLQPLLELTQSLLNKLFAYKKEEPKEEEAKPTANGH